MTQDRRIPIWVRITIDGLKEEMSTGLKLLDGAWDPKGKTILSSDPDYKQLNKSLHKIETDLEHHFNLIQAKNGFATPVLVLESYRTPINGAQLNNEKVENLAFSQALDQLIDRYIKFCKKHRKAYQFDQVPSPERKILLDKEMDTIKKDADKIVAQGNHIFDKKSHQKTFILAIDEYHLNFLQLALADKRSSNSIEKMLGRKSATRNSSNTAIKSRISLSRGLNISSSQTCSIIYWSNMLSMKIRRPNMPSISKRSLTERSPMAG